MRDRVSAQYDWDGNIDRYRPKDAKAAEGHVNIGADFADVERKKAALFFDTPAIGLTVDEPSAPMAPPTPPQPGQTPPPPPPTLGSVALIHQQLLNDLLGETGLGIKRAVGKCLLDVLLPAGVGPLRVGYSASFQSVDMPVPDPMTGYPTQGPDGEVVTQPVKVPIHEEFFASRLSPKSLLLPVEFRDTDIRNAPWVGHEFTMPVSKVRAEYDVPEDVEIPVGSGAKPYFEDDQASSADDPPVTGCYIEYRAMLEGRAAHPKAVWCLVQIDGMDAPLKHGPSPHQTFGEDGRLTPESVQDFTILPLWIRDLPDSAWVPSDSTITGPLTKELNKFRTQAVRQRESARQVILYDSEFLDPDAVDKIKKGEINDFVPVRGGALAAGAASIMAQVGTASLGRESYLGSDYIQADREKVMGISANQQGANAGRKTTATEASIVNKNTEARFNQEQARVMEWYLSVVRTLDCLIHRYMDARYAAVLVGQRRAQIWEQFHGALAGGYRYDVQTDSGKYLDIEASRRQLLQMYQMTRQDPLINPKPLIEKLLTAWGVDPVEGIAQPQPPQPTPPSVGVSFKGEDFNPMNPQFGIIVKMAQQGGWQITPQDIQAATQAAHLQAQQAFIAEAMQGPATPGRPAPQVKHGGPATQQMPISKRQADETGGRPGPGVPS